MVCVCALVSTSVPFDIRLVPHLYHFVVGMTACDLQFRARSMQELCLYTTLYARAHLRLVFSIILAGAAGCCCLARITLGGCHNVFCCFWQPENK